MKGDRSRLHRQPQRGSYDRDLVHAILDEALICHVGFTDDAGQTYVLPTLHARLGDAVYVHGARANRTLAHVDGSAQWCIEATIVDGLVLARSAFHHSMNFRSVVVFGVGEEVTDVDEKRRALAALVDRVEPGRSERCRPPTDKELRVTRVVRVRIEEASAKVRTGGPVDEPADLALPHWAGVVPVTTVRGAPEPDRGVVSRR